ncbi:GntR family transcriptional regulator [Flexivirga sp.]|uniref:GntR family transcriptional regulator n=1 Tax=Flexivirga sp. TaxID=1962927 RepID=UPI003F81DE77
MSPTIDSEPESARVIRRLRDEILDGVRVSGSKLVERDIAEELAVSRVPVREALKVLEAEGLVTLRPRTWAVVREFTPSDVADLNEVRSAVEPLTFRLAAQRHEPAGLAQLRSTVEAELAAARADDPIEARRAAADFHEVVTELSGNLLLCEWMQTMRSRMRWLMAQHDDLLHVALEHQALYAAIARRDLDEVAALAANHLGDTGLSPTASGR